MKDLSIVRLLYYIFKCVGLAPITHNTKSSFSTSTSTLLYNLFFASYVFAINGYSIKLAIVDSPALKFDRTVDCIYMSTIALTSVIIIAMYSFHRDKCANIANTMKALLELPTFNEKVILSKVVRETCLLPFFTWSSLILILPTVSFYVVLYFYNSSFTCLAIVNGAMMQYSLLFNFIKRLFEIVNENLALRKNQFATSEYWMKFSRMEEFHTTLSEVCEELDDFYSRPMLLCVFCTFLTLIFTSYYVVKFLSFTKNGYDVISMLSCLFQTIHALVAICVLVGSASSVVKEVN